MKRKAEVEWAAKPNDYCSLTIIRKLKILNKHHKHQDIWRSTRYNNSIVELCL